MKPTTTTTLPYYAGDYSIGCPPTPGSWDGDKFTAADGSVWAVDPDDCDPHPRVSGTGVHYLVSATTK